VSEVAGERAFRLASMSPVVRSMSLALCLVAPVCLLSRQRSAAAVICVVIAGVWLLLRPRRFVVDGDRFRIEWPLRTLTIPLDQIREIGTVSGKDSLRGVRVGAGGLWGTFGLLVGGPETVEIYVSRSDGLVRLARLNGRPLLISPEDPAKFVETMKQRQAESGRIADEKS
jgi:hypothetical protein